MNNIVSIDEGILRKAANQYNIPEEAILTIYKGIGKNIREELCQRAPAPRELTNEEAINVIDEVTQYVLSGSIETELKTRVERKLLHHHDKKEVNHFIAGSVDIVSRLLLPFRHHGERQVVLNVTVNNVEVTRIHPKGRACTKFNSESVVMK